MKSLKLLLDYTVLFFAFATPLLHATAAPSSPAQGGLFIAMLPMQVSSHLKTSKHRQIIYPYLWVHSKQAGEVICQWMPRVRDALFTVLNSPMHNVAVHKQNTAHINAALTQAIRRVTPRNLVAKVVAVDAKNLKPYRAENILKGKMLCPKNYGTLITRSKNKWYSKPLKK